MKKALPLSLFLLLGTLVGTLAQPNMEVSISSSTDVLCPGDSTGSACAQATGGVPPYQYVWNDPDTTQTQCVNGLPAGTWTVVARDNAANIDSAQVTIEEPDSIQIYTSSMDVSGCDTCDGKAIVDSVNGGTPPYTKQWDDAQTQTGDTASGLCAGNYTVTITDANNCTDSATVTVEGPAPLDIFTSSVDASDCDTCDGKAIVDSVKGGAPPYTKEWDDPQMQTGDTASGLCPGDYTVIVTDTNNCTDSATVKIGTQGTNFSVSTSTTPDTCGKGVGTATAEPSGGDAPYSYQWDDPKGQSSKKADSLSAGEHIVTVTDSNGCIERDTARVETLGGVTAAIDSKSDVSSCDTCDGSATASASGSGGPPFSYQWDDPDQQTGATADSLCSGEYTVEVTDSVGCKDTASVTIDNPGNLTVGAQSTPSSCDTNDGSATAQAVGGLPPYSYQWDDPNQQTGQTADGLAPGTYTVVVTDNNGCKASASVTVESVDGPTVTIVDSQNVTCPGGRDGEADAQTTGGTTPYSYQWDDPLEQTTATADSLPAGTWTVVVTDDNGCKDSASVTIEEPNDFKFYTSSIPASSCDTCDGKAIVDSVSGGTPPYDLTWDDPDNQQGDTAKGLCSGSYTVVLEDDEGCMDSTSVFVGATGNTINLSTSSEPDTCSQGVGTATVSPSGGTAPYTYEWNDPDQQSTQTADSLSAGTYIVTVTDADSCAMADTVTVANVNNVSASITSKENVSCIGNGDGSATAEGSGGDTPYSYQWDDPNNQTTKTADSLSVGTYNVVVTDAKGCSDTATVTIEGPDDSLQVQISSKTDVNCNGGSDGSATASASGGATPYSYQWDDPDQQTGQTADSLSAGTYTVVVTDSAGCQDSASVTIEEPAGMDLTFTKTDATCGDSSGTATVNVSGGTSPYDYQWDDPNQQNTQTADSLPAGIYTVVVTDADGCKDSGSVEINDVGGPNVTITDSNMVSCHGDSNGTATANASGGTPPYDFQWDDPNQQNTSTADSLPAGTWTVTVTDDNGCQGVEDVIITEPDSLVASIASKKDVSCNGDRDGEATADATGGTAPYDYQWDDPDNQSTKTADSLAPGTYTVVVTDDNGCQDSATVTIEEPPSLSVGISSKENVSCNGSSDGSATADPSGGTTPYDYQWDDPGNQTTKTADGLSAGTYTVVVTDNSGCQDSASVTIEEPDELNVAISSKQDVSCNGESNGSATADPSGGTTPYDYQWDDPNNQSTKTADGLSAGTYTVVVTDDNGCQDSASVTIDEPDELTISTSSTETSCNGSCDGSATAQPSGGTLPYSYQWDDPNNQTSKTADSLCAGTYEVTVTDDNGCSVTKSVVVQEPDPMLLSVNTTEASCGDSNGTATVSVTGGTTPYSYQWDDPNEQTTQTADSLAAGGYTVVVTDSAGCQDSATATVSDSSNINVSVDSISDVSCNGGSDGSASVSASGGTAPYTYEWDDPNGQTGPTATGLTAGTYTVKVTDDNGCTEARTISVSEPKELAASIETKSDVTCAGDCNGSATLTVEGGTSPYEYQWDDPDQQTSKTANDLCGGTYTAVVTDDMGCTDTVQVTIGEPDSLSSSTTTTSPSCAGDCDGSASVSVSGGTAPYSYQWDDSDFQTSATASGLCAGTYIVEVTDDNGCTITDTATVTDPNGMSLTIGNKSNSSCGNADGSATVDVSGGTSPYSYQWDDPLQQTTPTADSLSAGTYQVVVTDDNGCKDSISVSIQDEDGPSVAITDSNNVSCFGDSDGSATATPSGGTPPYSYQWDDPNGQTDSTANGLSAGTYTVTVTDDNGCTGAASVTIEEPDELEASITSSSNVSCNGEADGVATVDESGGTAPYSYQWDDPKGQTSATADSLPAGTYTVTVTDANGCTAKDSVTITEPDPLQISTTSEAPPCGDECEGEATANVSGGTSPYEYQWNDPDFQTSKNAVNLCPGNEYIVTVTDDNGCTATDTVSIGSGDNNLDVTTSTTDATCGNADGSATANVSGGDTPYSYQWDDPNNQTTKTASNLASGTYKVVVTDSNGCSATAIANVDDANGPDLAITDSSYVSCNGGQDGSATVTPSGGVPPYNYDWDDPFDQSDSTATSLEAGTYSVVVTDADGCAASISVTIEEPDALTLNATVVSHVNCAGGCDGSAQVDVNGGTPAYSYEWDDPSAQTTDTASGLCKGGYSVLVTDDNGCSNSASVTIEEPDELTLTASSTDATCGQPDGTATVNPDGGASPYNYNWSSGGSSQTETGLTPGTYTCVVTDANGCKDTVEVTIDNSGVPSGSVDSLSHVSCKGEDDGAISVDVSGGKPPYSYEWDDPQNQTGSTAEDLTAGIYTVTITDDNGCTITVTDTVTEPDAMSIGISKDSVSCWGKADGRVSATVSGATPPYDLDWSSGDTGSVADSLPVGLYSLTVTDSRGCTRTRDSIALSAQSNITVNTNSSADECDAGQGKALADAVNGTPPYSYQWNDDDAQTGSEATGLKAGDYIVVVTDDLGCKGRDTVTVESGSGEDCLEIPDVITPNGDGRNDTWKISGLDAYQNVQIKVFNRWGSMVYETTNKNTEWDGTRNGELLPEAAYYYVIELGDDKTKTGTISIVK